MIRATFVEMEPPLCRESNAQRALSVQLALTSEKDALRELILIQLERHSKVTAKLVPLEHTVYLLATIWLVNLELIKTRLVKQDARTQQLVRTLIQRVKLVPRPVQLRSTQLIELGNAMAARMDRSAKETDNRPSVWLEPTLRSTHLLARHAPMEITAMRLARLSRSLAHLESIALLLQRIQLMSMQVDSVKEDLEQSLTGLKTHVETATTVQTKELRETMKRSARLEPIQIQVAMASPVRPLLKASTLSEQPPPSQIVSKVTIATTQAQSSIHSTVLKERQVGQPELVFPRLLDVTLVLVVTLVISLVF